MVTRIKLRAVTALCGALVLAPGVVARAQELPGPLLQVRIPDSRIRDGRGTGALAVAPDGRTFATSSRDGLSIWDASSRRLLRTYAEDEAWELRYALGGRAIAWSTFGRFGVAAVDTDSIASWRVTDPVEREAHRVPLAVSSDGELAAVVVSNSLAIVAVASESVIEDHDLPATLPIEDVAFSPDGRLVVAAEFHARVHVVDRTTGRIRSFGNLRDGLEGEDENEGHSTGICFTRDSTALRFERRGRLWEQDLATLRVRDLEVSGSPVLSPDGRLAAVSGWESEYVIRIDGPANDRVLFSIPRNSYGYRFAFGRDVLASWERTSAVHLWDLETGHELHPPPGHALDVRSIAFGRDGSIASASRDETWRRGHPCDSSPRARAEVRLRGAAGIAACRGATAWLAGDPLRLVVDRGSTRASRPMEDAVLLAASPYAPRIVVSRATGDIEFREALDLEEVATASLDRPATSIAFSPDEETIAVATSSSTVHLLDLKGRITRAIRTDGHGATHVAFSPDGRGLAIGCGDGALLVEAGGRLETIETAAGGPPIAGLAFVRRGRIVVLSGGALRIVAAIGGELSRTESSADPFTCLATNPEGTLIACGHESGAITVWSLDP